MEKKAGELEVEDDEDFGVGKCAKYQKCIWDLMEKPESSKAAKIVSIISMSFVFVSIVGRTLNMLTYIHFLDL